MQTPRFCGVLQGYLGFSTVFQQPVGGIIGERVALTGWLMLWVMVVMVPMALVVGVLGAGLACVIFMLTLLDGFILRPLPFAEPDRLVQAGFRGDGGLGNVFPVDSRDLAGIRRYVAPKAEVAGAARSTINLSDLDRPARPVELGLLRRLAACFGKPLNHRDRWHRVC